MNAMHAGLVRDDALAELDIYYASLLSCPADELRAPGWTRRITNAEDERVAASFGMRQVVYLLAPVRAGARRAGPGGAAVLASELLTPVGKLLAQARPGEFFQSSSLLALDRLVRACVDGVLAPDCEPRLCVWYASDPDAVPPTGRWADWIERLDPATETHPLGRALLRRHAGGVFVARVRGSIVAYTGLRAYADRVWEVTPPELTTSAQAHAVTQPDGLLRALLARATRAALAACAIPTCTTTFREIPLRRSLFASGYRHYAHASVYATLANQTTLDPA